MLLLSPTLTMLLLLLSPTLTMLLLTHPHHAPPPIQHVCGYEYTARLQRMLVDMTLSSQLVTEFMESMKSTADSLPITFTALVLQVHNTAHHSLHTTDSPLVWGMAATSNDLLCDSPSS